MENSKPEAGSAVVEGGEASVASSSPAGDEGLADRRRKGEDVIRALRIENKVLLDHCDRMSRQIIDLQFEVERLARLDKANQAAIANLAKACEEEREACAILVEKVIPEAMGRDVSGEMTRMASLIRARGK